MEKVYVPANMLIDFDFGICSFLVIADNKPKVDNRIKRILRDRKKEVPIEEFIEKYPITEDGSKFTNENYGIFFDEEIRNKIFALSTWNENILSLVTTPYAFGLNNDIQCIIGYDYPEELEIIKHAEENIRSKANIILPAMKNSDINITDYDSILVRTLDRAYVDYLVSKKVNKTKIYVADYKFNTVGVDDKKSIPFDLMADLEKNGNMVFTISMYKDKL